MDSSKGNQTKLLSLLAVLIIAAAVEHDLTMRLFGQARDFVSGFWSTAGSATAASPSPSQSAPPDAQTQAQAAVEAFMRKNAMPQSAFSFLDWTDFTTDGPASGITLHYRVQQPARPDVDATVRFTLQSGNVVKYQLVPTGLSSAPAPAPASVPVVDRPRFAAPPPVVIDRFTGPIFAAEHGPAMTLELNDAFSLAQLDQARAKAQAEGKPLGFLMVWGQFFGHEADPRGKGSDSALVHFYQVFNPHLVLVFVRHETELGMVPRAVSRGFGGPMEGGYAPNMAVTDATATDFITEIPYKDLDGPGRDELFAAGGRKIDQWLATHPRAMPTPDAQSQ